MRMVVICVSVQQTKTQLTTAHSFNRTNWTMIEKSVNSFGGLILNEVMCFKILNCLSTYSIVLATLLL